MQWVLDSMTGAAAFVSNGSHDLIAANRLGEALWSVLYAMVDRPVERRPVSLSGPDRGGDIPRLGAHRERDRRDHAPHRWRGSPRAPQKVSTSSPTGPQPRTHPRRIARTS